MISKSKLLDLQNFSNNIATKAGKILLENREKVEVVLHKDSVDVATTADLASEKYILKSIQAKYPDHGIISEEFGELNEKADFVWIIDPLDGTKEYFRGLPTYNVSIALEYKGDVIVSSVFTPSEGVIYSAIKGVGSYKNKQKIRVSKTDKIDESFIYCYLPSSKSNVYDEAWSNLAKVGKIAYRVRSQANQNIALCWLAQGGVEAYINISNSPAWHDIAPGLLIAQEAGAIATDVKGGQLSIDNSDTIVVANNKKIHNSLLEIIAN